MLQRHYFAEYEKISRKLLKHRGDVPLTLIKKYEKILIKLREHLHQNKNQMPIAAYPYNPEDITTHAYIPDPDPREGRSLQNPSYKYKNLWKRVDGMKGLR